MLQGRDLPNEYVTGVSLAPATQTSTATGTGVDFQDCGPEVVGVVSYAARAFSDTGPLAATCIVKLQESDASGSGYADITSATFTTLTQGQKSGGLGNADAVEMKLFATRAKRYVRAVATIAGSSPSFTIGVTLHAPKKSY